MTDIFASLETDHRDVERLFERYSESADDTIAREICDTLTEHTEVEQQVLYPEIRRIVDGGDDLANDADAEHATISTLIARIYDSPPADLRPLIDELHQHVARHVTNEETELFPLLREAGGDAEALGRRVEAARAEAPSRSSGPVGERLR